MKILVINGSPKKMDSDVMKITNSFLDGVKDNADIKIIHTIEKDIRYCLGCFECMKNGGNCVIKDDMEEILVEILESDYLVFSYPLYCYSMPASLKALVDRMLPLSSMSMKSVDGRYVHVAQKDVSKIKCIMICGCGFPNSKKNFEPAVMQFRQLFPGRSIEITIPEAPMFGAKEALPLTSKRLELIKDAGKEYFTSGSINNSLYQAITSPLIDEKIYADIVNKKQ